MSRGPAHHLRALGDYPALAIATLIGAAVSATLPMRGYVRAVSVLIYIPVVALALVCFSVVFIVLFFPHEL